MVGVGIYIYLDKYMLTNKGTEISPDGEYKIVFQQVGSPEWPLGSVSVKVTVKNNKSNKNIDVIKTSLNNDGSSFSKYNWDVVWHDEKVEITLEGADDAAGTVYYVDLQ